MHVKTAESLSCFFVKSPKSGYVTSVMVSQGDKVITGQGLVTIGGK